MLWRFREVIERYEVRGMERAIDCVFPASIHLAARDKIAQHACRTEGDAVFADACFRERFGEERDDVRIGLYAGLAKHSTPICVSSRAAASAVFSRKTRWV